MQLSLIPDLVPAKKTDTKLPNRQMMLTLFATVKIEPKQSELFHTKPTDLFVVCE